MQRVIQVGDKRRLLRGMLGASGVSVGLLVVLGCGGMGNDAPTPTPAPAPAAGDTKLKSGGAPIERRTGRHRPERGDLEAESARGEYVVKLKRGVSGLSFPNGREVRSGRSGLDSDLGSLGLEQAKGLHERPAKNREVSERLGLDRTIHIKTNRPKDEVLARLEANPDVEWVEPASRVRAHGLNDPYYTHQWHLQNLNVEQAWKVTKGRGVTVAVVDTGVSVGEDGYFKLLPGYDFVENDARPDDLNGHGTHVAGTIGQRADNGIGVAGVAPEVSILPVRVLDANGAGSNTSVANGIIWAVDNGADIINLSLGSASNSEAVADACAYAYEHGVTVIAATGNDGFSDFIGYPAALDTTIAVGSVDRNNQVAFYSNQGKQIDLVGPGGDTSAGQEGGVVQETVMGGSWGYYFLQGTSMATPHVAGVAALVHAAGVKDPDAIRRVLRGSATDLGARGWDTTYGEGLVNPVAALELASRGGRVARGGASGGGGSGGAAGSGGGRGRGSGGGSGGGGRASGGGGHGGGDLEIVASRVRSVSETRAVIEWITSEPATTLVRGGAVREADDTPSKTHRVTVSGKPGATQEFEVASQAGGQTVRETLRVTF